MPSVNLKKHINHMQDQIGVEPDLIENNDEQHHLNQARGPAEDVLPDGKDDAGEAEERGGGFYPEHGGRISSGVST